MTDPERIEEARVVSMSDYIGRQIARTPQPKPICLLHSPCKLCGRTDWRGYWFWSPGHLRCGNCGAPS